MKIVSLMLLSMFAYMLNAQESMSFKQFYVNGNCEHCKQSIEEASNITSTAKGFWDIETHILTLVYDSLEIKPSQILKIIAGRGYDNEHFKAEKESYDALPACCQYERNQDGGLMSFDSMQEQIQNGESQKKLNLNEAKVFDTGYSSKSSDSTLINDIKQQTIEEVTITSKINSTSVSKLSTYNVTNIKSKELLKAACCNLSESFQTNSTVDVAYTNAVTGTKQIKMLGLDQKYTYYSKELLPDIRGLSSAYGANFLPGRWISGIQLTKGSSTVTSGYEGITGQINTELVKYDCENTTSFNAYVDNNSRTEANIVHASSINDQWNQTILMHGNATSIENDHNHDGFLDQPKGNQINLNYLIIGNYLQEKGVESMTGFNFVKDKRRAGQTGSHIAHQGTQHHYTVNNDIDRFQIWNKTGFIFKSNSYKSLGVINQFSNYNQQSNFGEKSYSGNQKTYYGGVIFESIINNSNHKYKLGANFLVDIFDEYYDSQPFRRVEKVPGIFGEYNYIQNKFTLISGVRADFHNLAGIQISPRINAKYNLSDLTILRASIGRGFRTANPFAENQQFMASNRQFKILDNDLNGKIYGLQAEVAWNYGLSFMQDIIIKDRKAQFVLDVYKTDFQNQVVVDLDQSTHDVLFYNLKGNSYALSVQSQLDIEVIENFNVRVAYKYYDVKTQYLSGLRQNPFVANHRGFINLEYKTPNIKNHYWMFDFTTQLIGKQRLPDTKMNPEALQLASHSPSYIVLNAQVSYYWNKKFRAYLGCDNLFSYRQKLPILDAENPFGQYFDGSMIYAPTMPVNIFVGVDINF